MMQNAIASVTNPFERLLLRLERPPIDGLYRALLGFSFFPLLTRIVGENPSGWTLLASFFGLLFTIRLVPALLRKVLPFSGAVKAAWAEQRKTAKRYDSYQWRKLFWFGVGLACHSLFLGGFEASRVILISTCLAAGALGLGMWRVRAREIASASTRSKA
jgi:hypothetical protein